MFTFSVFNIPSVFQVIQLTLCRNISLLFTQTSPLGFFFCYIFHFQDKTRIIFHRLSSQFQMSHSKILECIILKMHDAALNLLRTLSPCFCQDGSSTTQSDHYVKSLWYAKNLIVRKCHLNLYYSACRRSFISKAFLCYYRNSEKEWFIYQSTAIHFLTKKEPTSKVPKPKL